MSSLPSAYLRYLPAIYQDAAAPFVGDYLKIFEKLLTGIDDGALDGRRGIQELLAAQVIGNLFYPRLSFLFPPSDTQFMPPISGATTAQEQQILADLDRYIGVPTPPDPALKFAGQGSRPPPEAAIEAWLGGFLDWLGGWVDLIPDGNWSLDKKRNVIAQSLALYRMRGTPQGLSLLVNLLLDLPMQIVGVSLGSVDGENPPDPSETHKTPPGNITVGISNPAPALGAPAACITVEDDPASRDVFVLRENDSPPWPVVSGYAPWVFDVLITLPNYAQPDFLLTAGNVAQIQQLVRQLGQLLERIRPAATRFRIGIVPTLHLLDKPPARNQAASCATLGVNTLLGSGGDKAHP
ncbi:phage tail protein [Burkholderia sp. Cy-637]|uniref:phage tail protein n=1 Tax=Burkholderia sp. Cy-637 TaxID=2608327 RepID=UPI001420E7CF|nr:phage tail protein [Burkholderia sp. Cy-637]NIF92706.1 hypothetical protein [Burkholderia sp. Cy-637]